MITKEQVTPGTTVLFKGKETTVLQGGYEDVELGYMVKTSKYPGGMPLDKFDMPVTIIEDAEVVKEEPKVSFELAIIDEPTPVKLTAALIREKSKILTDITIKNMFDEAGYNAVKKAVTKAVKTRTSIEKKEKEVLDAMKLRHANEKKEVTDYTAELYTACREAQTALEAKLTVIDTAKKVAADKLAADEKERTEGRDNSLYGLGMTFNGQAFVGYGKSITKNSLYSFEQAAFDALITELEALQLEQGVTGEVKPIAPQSAPSPIIGSPSVSSQMRDSKPTYPSAIYDKLIFGKDIRIVLTKGPIDNSEPEAFIINDRIAESAIYLQVIDYTK